MRGIAQANANNKQNPKNKEVIIPTFILTFQHSNINTLTHERH